MAEEIQPKEESVKKLPENIITIEPLRRLMKDAGAERISDDAAKELSKYLEIKTIELIKESQKITQHSKRATITREDIKLAKNVVFR
jgi:DNA-binding protein